jgi:hypothetical protein
MQRTRFCCAKHWPSFSKFRKKVSKTKIFPLIIHQTLLHHLSWAHHLLCIYWNFRSKGHPINTSVSLTAASSSLDEMVMSSIINVICTAYYAATTLWWILFLACGHSRCDSHERYCPKGGIGWNIILKYSLECTHGQPHNSTHHKSCQVACACNRWPTGSPKQVIYNIFSNVILKPF